MTTEAEAELTPLKKRVAGPQDEKQVEEDSEEEDYSWTPRQVSSDGFNCNTYSHK